jgi:hypothetical protein
MHQKSTPSSQPRSSSSHSSLSPQSFSLHPECVNYLTCCFCAEPFTDSVFACPQHPDVKICSDCFRRRIVCFHCKQDFQRSPQIEEMLGMIAIICSVCTRPVRLSEYSKHRSLCETKGKFMCAFEIGETKCVFCTEKCDFLFTHYIVDHRIAEYNSLVDTIVLPHAQMHFHPREVEKPFKNTIGLPCYASLWYGYSLNFQGTRILLEFFYRIPSRSFMFIARSDRPYSIQIQMLVPQHSVYGISMGIMGDQVEVKEGKSVSFTDETPLHMHQNHMIRSICAFEIDLFDMFEKYSMIHGDCRFTQFGVKIVY